MIRSPFHLLIFLLLLNACSEPTSKNLEANGAEMEVGGLKISAETMNYIIQNIASPIEVAALINSLNIPYSNSHLANPDQLQANTSSFEMAYNLGALHADLSYLNIYNKTGTEISHLTGINRLADALQIGQSFDLKTFERLATTSQDTDTLLFLSINCFNNMENMLRETERSYLSAVLIAGVWMEGLYLATQAASLNNNEDLKSMIGDQKLILNDLLLVLNKYNNESIIRAYITDLEIIKSIYDHVKISYEVGEPQTIEKDGMLMVVQSETSQVDMSDETLRQIIEVTEKVRNLHLNIKS